MFWRSGMERISALSIWNGPGINPQKSPIAIAPGTERRLRCQRLGWPSQGRNGAAQDLARTVSGAGRYLRKSLRTRFIVYRVSRGPPRALSSRMGFVALAFAAGAALLQL